VKLLFANHTSDMSGAEIALLRLIAGLGDGHDCVVACPPDGAFPERLAEEGIDRVPLPTLDLTLRMHPVFTPVGLAQAGAAGAALRAHARRLGADVVHANSVRAGLLGAVADRMGSVPIVTQVHDHLPHSTTGRAARSMIARTSAGVVAVSNRTTDSFNEGLRTPRAERVYISIDPDCFVPQDVAPARIRSELGLNPDARMIAEVAQITPWKGQDVAIRMLAGLLPEFPDTHLLIVGQVSFQTRMTRFDNQAYLDGLHRLVGELGVERHVHFLGQRDDVPALFAAADFSVLPSWDEPFGTAAVESTAMGTPALVGNVGGIVEHVFDRVNGRTLPPKDADAWLAAARELLADRDLLTRMAVAARERAADFTDQAYARNMLGAYHRAQRRWHGRARRRGDHA
jgi:L-malate glycosyltransferase